MTVQHCLISPFGLGMCAAWAKLDKVIGRDITIYGTFAFLLNNNLKQTGVCKIEFGVSDYNDKLAKAYLGNSGGFGNLIWNGYFRINH